MKTEIKVDTTKSKNRIWWGCLALFVMSFVSGCGFHLRGYDSVGQVSFKTVFLQNELQTRPELQRAIRNQLGLSGVSIVNSESLAEVVLQLQPTAYSVSRTAFSGQGDATAELLKMSQSFKAIWVLTGNELVAGTVDTYRDRQIEVGALLTSEQELEGMRQSMAEDLARQMMDRINRAVQQRFALQKPVSSFPVSSPTSPVKAVN